MGLNKNNGRFCLFSNLTDLEYHYINQHSKQIKIPANKVLLKRGSKKDTVILLLKGKLKLISADGKMDIVAANSDRARKPIAYLRPSRYQVSTHTEVSIMVMSEQIFKQALAMEEVEELETVKRIGDKEDGYDGVIFNILSLLQDDQLVLPSMPDIALKVRRAIEDVDSDLNDIIKVINMDQAIVSKIINTANSAMYNTSGKYIENSKNACMRLGSNMIMNIVQSHTMKNLFHTNSLFFQSKMKELWHHSVKTAAIGSILARITPGFKPEKALLAGLLHNIGSVVVLNHLSDEQIKINDISTLNKILFSLQGEVGGILLDKWGFSNDIIEVAKYSTDFFYNEPPRPMDSSTVVLQTSSPENKTEGKLISDKNDEASYTDIINIAQIHAYIGTPYQSELPVIEHPDNPAGDYFYF